MANVLITLYGRSTWGLFNSVWSSIKEHKFLPDRVHILTAGCEASSAHIASRMVQILLQEYGSKAEVLEHTVDDEDVRLVAELVGRIAGEEKRLGNKVALDVTPGKKVLVLGSVFAGPPRQLFDHIFYLHIGSLKNANRAYVEIPRSLQHSHDIMLETTKGEKEGQG
ncbi:MAG: hypothetical protein NT137_06285 [Methanomassiliicoccales archaeon]|nr:hypothetical protein [Methanomassiliicoccales archaeon]